MEKTDMDIGIDMVHAHIVYPDETKYIGLIPYDYMYIILDVLSKDGKYEVFATEDGGKVVGHLAQNNTQGERIMTGQYFLYKVVNGKDQVCIFDIREDEDGTPYGFIVTMESDKPIRKGMPETIRYMRQAWKDYKKTGWKDTATCHCGKEYDAGWYTYIGQCHSCETQDELEAQHEWV
jgi:hypothetical protein